MNATWVNSVNIHQFVDVGQLVGAADGSKIMDNFKQTASIAVGWLITLGSLLLYTPMIFRVLRKRSAVGLSNTTWWMKFSSYSATLVYNVVHQFPLNSYVVSFVGVALEKPAATTIIFLFSFLF